MRHFLTALAIASLTAGCAAMAVSSHIERNINFAEYQTYDWGPPDHLPAGDPRLDNNPFFQDYVQGAIEKKLQAKGYERAVTDEPDLLIHYHASVSHKVDVYAADQRYGYCYGTCEPQVIEYEEGTLVIDVVDRKTSKVIWRGWAQDAIDGIIDDQYRLEKQVHEGVMKMMLRLPAGGAALR